MKNQLGYTLNELLVVIVFIAVALSIMGGWHRCIHLAGDEILLIFRNCSG